MGKYDFIFTERWFFNNEKQLEIPLRNTFGDRPIKILEVGTYEGCSTFWFLQNLNCEITTIDISPQDNWYTNLSKLDKVDRSRITQIKGYSSEVLLGLDDTFDFIYIDGSHYPDDIMTDGVLSLRLLKSGGLIAFDDYHFDSVESLNWMTSSELSLYMDRYSKSRMFSPIDYSRHISYRNRISSTVTPRDSIQCFFMCYSSILDIVDVRSNFFTMYMKGNYSTMNDRLVHAS